MRMSTVQFGAAVTLVCAALALPSDAGAVDLRDWGRKYDNASERFELLASFNNEAVLHGSLSQSRLCVDEAAVGARHSC
jgi:hypothetical protein